MANKILPLNDIAFFCEQISIILSSGISIEEGLGIMYDDATTTDAKSILSQLINCIEEGKSMSEALSDTEVFPKYMIDMLSIGEKTGKTEDVMKSLHKYYLREYEVQTNIKTVLRYPLIMISMMIVVILVLIIKVLPIFNQVFSQIGVKLTGISAGIMNFGGFLSKYAIIFIGIILLIIGYCLFLSKTQKGQSILSKIKNNSIFTKKTYYKISQARFADGISMILSSGMDINEGISICKKLIENESLDEKIEICEEYINSGDSIGEALSKAQVFNGVYGKMVSIGFKSGNIDSVMNKILNKYNEEIDEELNRKISLIEPTLVGIFSVIVGFILLSVMLPLMSVMTAIG